MVEETKKTEVTEEAEAPKPVKKVAKKAPVKKVAPKAEPKTVWFESRDKEPTMFPVAGINPIRNFSTGRLEYEVPADDLARFEQNHFVMNARIKRKA